MQLKEDENLPITGETLKLQDVENFFKYAINPSLIEAKIEKTTAAMIRKEGGLPLALIIAVAIVFVAGAVAFTIVQGYLKTGDMTDKLIACEKQLSTYKAPVVTQSSQTAELPIAIK